MPRLIVLAEPLFIYFTEYKASAKFLICLMEEELDKPEVGLEQTLCNEEDQLLVKSIENEAGYIGRRLKTDARVPGNIHKAEFRQFWESELETSDMVLSTIRNGYSLPFRILPPPSHEGNNASAKKDMEFVRAEVFRLEKLGCIERVEERPLLVLPLSSVFSKKKRLVVDASRALNPYLLDQPVRLQDLRDVPMLLKPGQWMAVDDLDSGYWHLAINPADRKYLGIHITDEKTKKPIYFVWRVLFLGVKSAVFIFTAILKPIRVYLAKKSIPVIIYLDDAWCGGENERQCFQNRDTTRKTLQKAGFVVSVEKAKNPATRILFLGLEIDSEKMMYFIPEKKIEKILAAAREMLRSRKVQLRVLASFLGFIQSCGRALGNILRLMSRASYNFLGDKLNCCPSYKIYYALSEEVKEELRFWIENIHELNGYPINPSLSQAETRITVVTDASGEGAFGYEMSDRYKVLLRKAFSEEERRGSSTVRELLALKFIYTSALADPWKGEKILHLTDNQAVVSITQNGSSSGHLQKIAVEIFRGCRERKIELSVEWRSRDNYLLVHADIGSKSFDPSSFSMNFESFAAMLEFFSEIQIDVDVMAEHWNRKSQHYFSKNPDPFSCGTNFFAQDLNRNLFYYCFPPPGLITPAILHFAKFQTSGLLVVPVWPSSSFWLSVCPDGRHLAGWAVRYLRFRPGIIADINIRSTTFKSPLHFDLLVIKFCFAEGKDVFEADQCRIKCIFSDCDTCG